MIKISRENIMIPKEAIDNAFENGVLPPLDSIQPHEPQMVVSSKLYNDVAETYASFPTLENPELNTSVQVLPEEDFPLILANIDASLNRKKRKLAKALLKKDLPPRNFIYGLFTNSELSRFFTLKAMQATLSQDEVASNFMELYKYVLAKMQERTK